MSRQPESARMRIAQSEKLYSSFPANGSYLETSEPYEPCTRAVLVFQGSDDGLTAHRHPRARRSPPHLGKGTNVVTKQQAETPRATQAPEGWKRRRIRTASSGGRGN